MIHLTGGEALIRSLVPEGIDTVFGLTGGKLTPVLGAIAGRPTVRYIGARHEGSAALMAAGYAAASGRVAALVAECGSGAANIVPGLAVATADSLPLVAITSNNQHAMSYPGRGLFAEMDTHALLRPVTKWNTVVHDGRRIPELVHTALREALCGRPGAVHLDLPQDVLRGQFDYEESELDARRSAFRVEGGPAPSSAQVSAAAALLREARRPLIIAGGGSVRANASEPIRALAERTGAAVAATQSALGVLSSVSANYIGHATVTSGPAYAAACREADVVLAVGCRFSPWLWGANGPLPGQTARVIHVCNDVSSLGQHVPLGVGLWADARDAVSAILEETSLESPRFETRAWLDQLRALGRQHQELLAAMAADNSTPMHPAALSQAIGSNLPDGAIVIFDGGHTTFWSNDFTPAYEPHTRIHEVGMTQLGFGLPYAIAARLASPSRPVVNITGDGAFGFTIQELDTARRYALPVVNIIHNNAAWGVIRHVQQQSTGLALGGDLDGTDYAAIARGFGCHGEVVTKPAEVAPALSRALHSGLPAVLDCRVRFVPHPCLAEFGRMSSVGLAGAAGNP